MPPIDLVQRVHQQEPGHWKGKRSNASSSTLLNMFLTTLSCMQVIMKKIFYPKCLLCMMKNNLKKVVVLLPPWCSLSNYNRDHHSWPYNNSHMTWLVKSLAVTFSQYAVAQPIITICIAWSIILQVEIL